MKGKRFLVIAPHPDDEILGCGGTMRKLVDQGLDVYTLIVTKGSPKYYSEERIEMGRGQARDAHKIIGLKDSFFMDFHAPELEIQSRAEISNAIVKLIKELEVDTIMIPHRGDIHHDHFVVFNSALVAARPVGEYSVKNIYAYETLSETEWAPPFGDDAFIPTHFENIEGYIDVKTEAMNAYKGQVRIFPNPRSVEAIKALSMFRGATVGVKNAEAFMTIRTIE